MTKINLKVNGASAAATLDGVLTSGMVGVPVTIEYNKDWSGLLKTCVFRVGSLQRDRKNIANATTVPWEVMRHYNKVLEIGVEGRSDDGDIVIPTIWTKVGTIKQGANATVPGAPNPEQNETPSGNAIIDDSVVDSNRVWSSKNTVDKLCPNFMESGSVVTCNPVDGYPINVVSHIVPVQEGSGDPSPDNVRPITGHSAVKLWQGGLNLWDEVWELGSINVSGSETVNATTIRSKNYIPVKGGVKLCIISPQVLRLLHYDANKNLITYSYPADGVGTFTPSKDGYLKFAIGGGVGGNTAITEYGNNICISVDNGGTAVYEPYRGETITLDFGQTVYGGSLDWGSGLLTVTHGNIESYTDESVPDGWISSTGELTEGSQVVYPLAEPITVQLTPQEIVALSGVNTLYSDTGDTEVKGKADPAAVIENLTNAIIALGGNV